MEAELADDVLDLLLRGFSSKKMDPEEIQLWEEKLEPYEYEDGIETASRLIDELDYFPAWATFRERITAIVRNRRALEHRPELPAPTVNAKRQKIWIRKIREQNAGLNLDADRKNAPPRVKKHTSEHWDSCEECLAVNAAVEAEVRA